MPLMVQGVDACLGTIEGVEPPGSIPGRRPGRLDIGLVNNMPDVALKATERQFARLLAAASGPLDVHLHLFSLGELPRGDAARSAMAGRYRGSDALERARLDALIVTGAEPLAPSLADEPYWDALTRVVDWAEHNTVSTIWSCLAAHAAVLHLDGIARRKLPRKRFGLFECVPVADGGLFAGAPSGLRVPHSRWNDLAEGDLRSHGYRIASRSMEAGIDCFTKQWASLFVFLQGHPEYDADTLFREYRRDAHRFLAGHGDDLPALPSGYFDARTEGAVADFEARARKERSLASWDAFPRDWACRLPMLNLWQASATQFYRNWLGLVAADR